MPRVFVVEDERHVEIIGEFLTLQSAWDALKQLSEIPWDKKPNLAPCQSWPTCGRDYEIIEYDTSVVPWAQVCRHAGLKVSAEYKVWGPDAPYHGL